MSGDLWKLISIVLFSLLLQQVDAASEVNPNVIYGDDNRVDYYQITDPQVRAASASTVALVRAQQLTQNGNLTNISTTPYGTNRGLCPEEPFFNQEVAPFCSGFLIAPDTVVTAGHCISDQSSCNNTRMIFGFRINQENEQPRAVPTIDVFGCSSVVHSVSKPAGEDFAVVKLDRPVTQVPPLLYRREGKINVGESLRVIGHPAGLPLKVADGAQVRTVKPQFLTTNLDTYGGNSGSAVFNAVTGEVEGVLVRGEADYVIQNGCRVSNLCPNDGCRGEDVTLFERVLPYLN